MEANSCGAAWVIIYLGGRVAMLVYHKEPMGYIQLGLQRVYGKHYCKGRFGPTDLDYNIWQNNKDILIEAEYTKEWLENKYKKEFPPIEFKISTLKNLDDRTLKQLAILVGVKFHNKWGSPRLDQQEKNAVIRSVTLALNDKL